MIPGMDWSRRVLYPEGVLAIFLREVPSRRVCSEAVKS